MAFQASFYGTEDVRFGGPIEEGEAHRGPNLTYGFEIPNRGSIGNKERSEYLETVEDNFSFKVNARLIDPGRTPIDLGSVEYSFSKDEFVYQKEYGDYDTLLWWNFIDKRRDWPAYDDDIVQSSEAYIEFTMNSKYEKPSNNVPGEDLPDKKLYRFKDNDTSILSEEEQENLEEESLFGSLDYPAEDTLTTYLAAYTVSGKFEAPAIESKQEGVKGRDRINGYLEKKFESKPAYYGFNDLIYGYEGKDKLYGNAGADYLVGGQGNDKLIGGDGDDILIGNEGNDKFADGNGDDLMLGGTGKDKFKIGKGANVIMDFEKGDKLRIKGSVTWAQEDFGMLATYRNGTLALIGDSSELLKFVV